MSSSQNTVVFCDLDGTYVLDNSFHVFMGSLWQTAGFGQKLTLARIFGSRALGRLNGGHAGLKRRVLTWFENQTSDWQNTARTKTLQQLALTVSDPIRTQLAALRADGAQLVLATAAPAAYADQLARDADFDACIATPAISAGWAELLADQKAEACAAWLKTNAPDGARIVVLTDHPDDLPLLRMADHAVLQTTDRRHGQITSQLTGPTVARIDPVAAQDGGGIWLWFDSRPEGPIDTWDLHMILSKHRHAALYVGGGQWRRVLPGDKAGDAVLRRDTPLPPAARARLTIYLRRRVMRDFLGIFH